MCLDPSILQKSMNVTATMEGVSTYAPILRGRSLAAVTPVTCWELMAGPVKVNHIQVISLYSLLQQQILSQLYVCVSNYCIGMRVQLRDY